MEPMAPSCNASSPQPRPNPAELPGQPLGSKQHAGPPGCAEGSSRKPSSIMGLREHLQRDAARGQAASSALQNGSGTLPSVPPLAPRGSGQQCRSLRCSPRTKPCPERRLVQLPDARTFTPCSHSAALPESPQCKTRTHPKAQRPRGSHMSSSSTDPLAAPSLQPGWNPSCNPNPPRAAQLGFLSVWVTFSPQRPGMRLDLFFFPL